MMSILSSSGPETRAWYFLISVSEQVQRARRVPVPAALAGVHGAHQHEAAGVRHRARRAGYGHHAVLDAAGAAPRARRGETPAARPETARRCGRGSSPRAGAARRRRGPPQRSCDAARGRAACPQLAERGSLGRRRSVSPSWLIISSRLMSGRMETIRLASMLLPAPGGPTMQYVVSPGSRDFEGALYVGLALDLGEIRQPAALPRSGLGARGGLDLLQAAEIVQQLPHAHHGGRPPAPRRRPPPARCPRGQRAALSPPAVRQGPWAARRARAGAPRPGRARL